MRALIYLAVLGVSCVSLSHQAYLPPSRTYSTFSSLPSHAAPDQPRWTGPLASSVPAGVNGQVVPVSNTHEVAAARNEFFDTYNRQLQAVGGNRPSTASASRYAAPSAPHNNFQQPKWTGPLASSVPAGVNGQVVPVSDTREVAAARNEFFDTYNRQLQAVGGNRPSTASASRYAAPTAPRNNFQQPKWTGLLASSVPAGVNGQVVPVSDTHEVAAARNEFFNTYNRQLQAVGGSRPSTASRYAAPTAPRNNFQQPKWTGPLASSVPAGVNGQVVPVSDTREVAAARNEFFDTYNRQLQSVGGNRPSTVSASRYAAPTAPHNNFQQPKWMGPLASSLPAGVNGQVVPVSDTHEVAAARNEFFNSYDRQLQAVSGW